jgi:acyl carrier protein
LQTRSCQGEALLETKDIHERIKRILVEDLELSAERVDTLGPETPLLGQGIGLDSMETLTLVTGMEREFAIEVQDAELRAELFESLGRLADFVQSKLLTE